mgnify:CR=1 FL=1
MLFRSTVLLLLAASVIWHSAAPDAGWARTVGVAVQGLALLATLRISNETPRLFRLASVLVPLAIVLTVVGDVVQGNAGDLLSGLVGLLIVLACPVAIVRSVVKHPTINLQTVLAAICIYLLLGLLFAYILGVEIAIVGGHFMDGVGSTGRPTGADLLYFSFITLTTTGYGDITAATRVGRTTAMVEAMVGQLYLVTVLAILVSNLGHSRQPAATAEDGGPSPT